MDRIINHWSGGTNEVSASDLEHYHRAVDGAAIVHKGNEQISDNIVTSDGDYAAHVRNLNTGSIGNAACGMRGAQEYPFDVGEYPINEFQFDALCELTADQCISYGIPVSRRTTLTHAEVEPTLGVKQRGKWDFTRLPWLPNLVGAIPVGDFMRTRIQYFMGVPLRNNVIILSIGDKGAHVIRLQSRLVSYGSVIKPDGIFGPRTELALLRFQSRKGLTVDGIAGPETWGALE